MAVIEVEEQLARALQAEAEIRNMSIQRFLQHIAQTMAPVPSEPAPDITEFDRFIDEEATESPVLPDSFSRADIYNDHD